MIKHFKIMLNQKHFNFQIIFYHLKNRFKHLKSLLLYFNNDEDVLLLFIYILIIFSSLMSIFLNFP